MCFFFFFLHLAEWGEQKFHGELNVQGAASPEKQEANRSMLLWFWVIQTAGENHKVERTLNRSGCSDSGFSKLNGEEQLERNLVSVLLKNENTKS